MANMKVAPLKSSFMLAAMLGFMITIIYTSYGRISETWGFALGFLFALMFVASFISMSQAPIEAQLEINKDMISEAKPKKRKSAAKKKKK
jgi:hypothetical protein